MKSHVFVFPAFFFKQNTGDRAQHGAADFPLSSTRLTARHQAAPFLAHMVYAPATHTRAAIMDKVQCFVKGEKIGEGVLHRHAETIVAGYDAFESTTDFFMTFYHAYTYHKYIEQRMKQILLH